MADRAYTLVTANSGLSSHTSRSQRTTISETIVIIFVDIMGLSQAAAEFFARSAVEAVAARGRFSVALTGGATPRTLYDLLAQAPYSDQMIL